MTIPAQTRKAGPYAGDGTNKTFPFAFKVFASADLQVLRTSVVGVETVLTTGYAVDFDPMGVVAGGSIQLDAAPSAGEKITILGVTPIEQPLELINSGGFYPTVLNAALDKQTAFAQQNAEKIGRALKFAASDDVGGAGDLPHKAQRVGRVLAFEVGTGKPVAGPTIANAESVGGAVAAIEVVAANLAAINAVPALATAAANSASNAASSATAAANSESNTSAMLGTKVDKVAGKGLSSQDFQAADKVKLATVQQYATANKTDAYLLDRVNHMGSQLMSTISDRAGKVFDAPIMITNWDNVIDTITIPGLYFAQLDDGFTNGYFAASSLFVFYQPAKGLITQTRTSPFLGVASRTSGDGGANWTGWVETFTTESGASWYNNSTAEAPNAVINSNGLFSRSISSNEFKTAIEPMGDSFADAIIEGAQPIYYRSTCEADPQDWSYWGISAEQLADIDPRLVHWGHGTKEVEQPLGLPPKTVPDLDSPLKPVGVQYSRLVPALLNVVKRQGAALAALEVRVQALENGGV